MINSIQPIVSIIIPVYKDWVRLSTCLDALKKQSFSQTGFEVIVVNNNPADLPPDFILDFLYGNVILLDESAKGSYAARNAALRVAKGRILGFTDSDCVPDFCWIERAVAHFSDQRTMRLGGRIDLFFKGKSRTPVESYEKVFAFPQDKYVREYGIGATANLFVRREVFEKIGYFRQDLFSGGDYEWGKRACDNEFSIKYADDVIVFHPARSGVHEITSKTRRIAGGHVGLGENSIFFTILKGFISPFKDLPRIVGSNLSSLHIVFVFLFRFYLRQLSSFEQIRVFLGGSPIR